MTPPVLPVAITGVTPSPTPTPAPQQPTKQSYNPSKLHQWVNAILLGLAYGAGNYLVANGLNLSSRAAIKATLLGALAAGIVRAIGYGVSKLPPNA